MKNRANHRFCQTSIARQLLGVLLFFLGILISGRAAIAQAAAATPIVRRGDIPPADKTASALSASQISDIRAGLTAEIAALTGSDPLIAKSARERIEGFSKGSGISPAYQAAFTQALVAVVKSALATKNARVRVTLAVIVERVASNMRDGTLTPLVLSLMNDPCDAVVLWGIKAAKWIYPAVLGVKKADADALASGVIRAVRKYPLSGSGTDAASRVKTAVATAIAKDAFETLAGEAATSNDVAAMVHRSAAVDWMIQLLKTRAAIFQTVQPGADSDFPPDPGLETKAMNFLALTAWPTMTEAQRAAAGRAMFDLASEMIRLAPLTPARVAGDPLDHVSQQDLVELLNRSVQAIQVAGSKSGAFDVVAAAQTLTKSITTNINQALLMQNLASLEEKMTAAKLLAPKSAAAAGSAVAPAASRPPVAGGTSLNK